MFPTKFEASLYQICLLLSLTVSVLREKVALLVKVWKYFVPGPNSRPTNLSCFYLILFYFQTNKYFKMNVASSLTSLSIFFVILAVAFFDVTTSASLECTDDELDEAQKAFRNCVDSAKAGIVSRHAPTLDDNDTEEKEEQQEVPPPPLCDELVNTLENWAVVVAQLAD